jgi:hypothetical protein
MVDRSDAKSNAFAGSFRPHYLRLTRRRLLSTGAAFGLAIWGSSAGVLTPARADDETDETQEPAPASSSTDSTNVDLTNENNSSFDQMWVSQLDLQNRQSLLGSYDFDKNNNAAQDPWAGSLLSSSGDDKYSLVESGQKFGLSASLQSSSSASLGPRSSLSPAISNAFGVGMPFDIPTGGYLYPYQVEFLENHPELIRAAVIAVGAAIAADPSIAQKVPISPTFTFGNFSVQPYVNESYPSSNLDTQSRFITPQTNFDLDMQNRFVTPGTKSGINFGWTFP